MSILGVCTGQIFQARKNKNFDLGPAQTEREIEISARPERDIETSARSWSGPKDKQKFWPGLGLANFFFSDFDPDHLGLNDI